MTTRSETRTVALFWAVALGLVWLFQSAAGSEPAKIRLDASGIERDARLINLRFDRAGAAITLDDAELIEDDAPATGVPEDDAASASPIRQCK